MCFGRREAVAMLYLGVNKQPSPHSSPSAQSAGLFAPRPTKQSSETLQKQERTSEEFFWQKFTQQPGYDPRKPLSRSYSTFVTPTCLPRATFPERSMADGILDVTNPLNVPSVLVMIGAVLCFVLGRVSAHLPDLYRKMHPKACYKSLKRLEAATRVQMLEATDEELEVEMGETGRRREEKTTRMQQRMLLAETPAASKICCDHAQWPRTVLFRVTKWRTVRHLEWRLEAAYYKVQGHLEIMGRTPLYGVPDEDAD
ncbi:hypothetical protein MSAN_01496000 [Mycena sanguinolenta]|uniref:Uncharacterized protein n=1 Tax=Mycena sanguinolenta TaxID=230812 RepID=A0A8H7CMY1_9AGAR|nr:hypothetical protein MSAN_02138700 [Mycena sanguinolenta]KAF7343689.1 hypothetical protein MSAN_01948800 [Mycena sanguinolenta]KAF7355780.1 hypothetical protein MSAN_01496000 [Mycena sanguinolenta]